METVKFVVETFIDVVTSSILKNEKPVLRHFGVFWLKTRTRGFSIKFKAAMEFKKTAKAALQELLPMEKLGVTLSDEQTLLAKITGQCPDCHDELETKTPPKCPKCGTAPFEEKKP